MTQRNPSVPLRNTTKTSTRGKKIGQLDKKNTEKSIKKDLISMQSVVFKIKYANKTKIQMLAFCFNDDDSQFTVT